MSSGAQQLNDDFEQVKKLLETYPEIKIIKTKGDPPEQYDIEYTIKGYKTGPDGTATPDNKHEVRITLPFGYPHFPPTAKPITSIFHPDIDPDAIRIADFWQENNSLPELIIHIGQMICGNHYTKDEPFNQRAFEWFEERKSWLPFDILEPWDEDEAAEKTITEPHEASGKEAGQTFAPATDLDILKDDIDFSFDDEESGGPDDEISFAIEEDTTTVDLTDLEEEKPADEVPIDLGDEDSTEPFNIQDSEKDATDDLFSFEPEETPDDTAPAGLSDGPVETASMDEASSTGDLFDLETETTGEEDGEGTPLVFDSEDITSAFEEEMSSAPENSEALDRTLDDLAGIDEKEEDLDFGIAEESMAIGEEATVDLSGLEKEPLEEQEEEIDLQSDESADEAKILSALSLDEDLSSTDKLEENSLAIRSVIEQKKIFSAKKMLADLPDPDLLPDHKELELTITDAVSEAEELFKKADKHEQKGEYEKAGILLDLVANIATDFPGLDFARNRMRESMMGGGKKKADTATDPKETEQAQEGEAESTAVKPDQKKKKARAKLSFKVPSRLLILLLAGVMLIVLGAGTAYIYNNDSDSVQLASTIFQRAEQLVDRKEFKDAQKELNAAEKTLEKVLVFYGAEKKAIHRKIADVADSSLFKEGLKGRVLYGDEYVSLETAKAIDKFNTQKSLAEQVLKGGKLDQAITAYEKSLPYAEKAGFDEQVKTISLKIKELHLQGALSNAKQSEKDQEWLAAGQAYQNALELSKDISTPEVQKNIIIQLANSNYRQSMNESAKAIRASQWQKSIEALERAQGILQGNPQIVPEAEIVEIDKLLARSRLYFTLSAAKKAFEGQHWEEAIKGYDSAVEYMRAKTDLLGEEATEGISKINKAVLNTQIAREQVEIVTTQQKKKPEKTLDHYQTIVQLIENSQYKTDETLDKILDNARTKTEEIKNELVINKREKWLEDNYEEIFRENYPSAKSSKLLHPNIQFVKKENNSMIFTISCTELKQGRKYSLTLNYQFNVDKKSWSLYSGKLEEEQKAQ